MEKESFIDAYLDMPEDLSGTDSSLYVFRVDDFGDWRRRVRNAHEREVDDAVADAMTDAELAEHGLVRLPTDADGEYIHIGDVMEWPYGNGEFMVEGIGGNTLFYIDKDSNKCEWTAAGDKRHHHKPTVDGILRDFGVDIAHALDADPNATVPEAVIAEYAAKLRLREE